MQKKVLMLAPFYPPNIGGAETFVKNLLTELKKKVYVIILAYQPMRSKTDYYELYANHEVYRMDWLFTPNKVWAGTGIRNFFLVFPKMLMRAIQLQWYEKFEICYAHGLIACFITAFLRMFGLKKSYGILLALYDFKNSKGLFRVLCKYALNKQDKIFVEGVTGQHDVLDLGISKDKIVIFQHWCDPNVFYPDYHINKQMVVLLAGRLDLVEKGKSIIEAVEGRMKDKEIKFVYAKDVPHKNMARMFQMADVCIVPSVYMEGFPLTVIEAASCGCAVITSNNGSLPELMKDFGLAMEADIRKFELILCALYNDRNLLKTYKNKSIKYAKEYFSPDNASSFLKEVE